LPDDAVKIEHTEEGSYVLDKSLAIDIRIMYVDLTQILEVDEFGGQYRFKFRVLLFQGSEIGVSVV